VAKIPLLFDTDIGSDIDDAVALAYLLKQPECDLLGIATVTAEPEKRAMLADAVCRAFGRTDVPIFSGAARPMLVKQKQTGAEQAAVLPKWPHKDAFAPNAAVDFLRQTIRSRPGEITLLSVGPLTNVGLLYALDPQIPTLLKAHVLMGGHFLNRAAGGYQPTEWNAICDPHATAVVFSADVPAITCVGLDVTTHCTMPADECRRRFSKGPLAIVGEMAEVWFQRRPMITFHDPLAAALVFEPDLCTFTTGRVEVELQSDRLAGFTHFASNAEPNRHRVAATVEANRFLEHYFATVNR
jgi:purine nucleosidase